MMVSHLVHRYEAVDLLVEIHMKCAFVGRVVASQRGLLSGSLDKK